jgi:hypothetical protein
MPTALQTYIPDKTSLPEFSLRAVLLGAVLGVIFGASSLYLVLKVGLTVSGRSWVFGTRPSSKITSCRRRVRQANRLPSGSA